MWKMNYTITKKEKRMSNNQGLIWYLLKWVYHMHSLEDGWSDSVVQLFYSEEIQFVRFVHE